MHSLKDYLPNTTELNYKKPHLSFEKQIEKLKCKNLIIKDERYAMQTLQKINYYRLSAYFLPFYDKNDVFKPNVCFEDIINLYEFDASLRGIFFKYLQIIEIYLRTQIAYYHSEKFGAFGYLKKENFNCENDEFDYLHEKINDEKNKSKEIFIKHFEKKYKTSDLPIWAVVEILSFGNLSRFYKILQKDEQEKCISGFDINRVVFDNWLHALSSIRNICAHHSRLWNKTLGISFKVPRKDKILNLEKCKSNKIFFAIYVIKYILLCIDDKDKDFECDIKNLFLRYKTIDKKSMGYLQNY